MSTIVLRKAFLMTAILTFAAALNFGQITSGKTLFGETLTYEGKLSKIIQGIPVADLKFSVSKAADSENYLIKTEAVSKGTLLKLFRFNFLQQYETLVDRDKFRVLKTTKRDVQKDRVRDSVADFDYTENRVRYTETDPKDPNRPPRRIASLIGPNVQDLVSGIYAIRFMPLTVGKMFEITISDSGLVYDIPVRVAARERIKSIFGKVWCYRVEPLLFGKDRLIEQKGSMVIWYMDDARRLPVRSRIDTEYGKVEVKLKTATPAAP